MANAREYRFSVLVDEPFDCSVADSIELVLRGATIATVIEDGEQRHVVIEHATVETRHP
jgi:hypothetical protein